jgi:ribosome-associated protein
MTEEPKTIHLEQFLKLNGIVGTGGNAKMLIQNGEVRVNNVVETRRKKQLVIGDRVQVGGRKLVVNELR